jgi:trehalose-phosphatase
MTEGGNDSASIEWWARVLAKVQSAPRCVLFLDFDGTLAELRKKPDQARLPEATRQVLKRLAKRANARVFFISGRRRSDLVKRVRLRGCEYLGLFGFEGPARVIPAGTLKTIQRLRADAAASIAGLPNVWVEDKGMAFVLHYRDAPPDVRTRARRRVRALLKSSPAVRRFESAHGLEVVPRAVTGKGAAVRQVLRRPALRRAVPIYLGDDVSDEGAFRAARRGVTIRVGAARATAAKYQLANPRAVRELLELLAQALR